MQTKYLIQPLNEIYHAGKIQDMVMQAIAKRVFVEVNHVKGEVTIDDGVYGGQSLTPTEVLSMKSLIQSLPVYVGEVQ